ncbi:hypothetical protein B0E38_03861 [Streptomyces sp. 111WW2]|uniref:hypothetical protein n=1 Tax=unclassified Streptomyces TaxID=2593676 RepID=UPI000D0C7A76|nr:MULTISPECIES: hypothetical protein [unclassified Streptomyces]MDX3402413.1 hypothetical protein [Streptomyces sp. ME01-18h]PSK54293.1 hypothetical protein B0E38_03861 [Streptomyces sp. 111WW2]
MSTVRARVWRFKIEKGKAGAEAVQAVEIGQGPLPVSLAAMVNINALACDLRKTVDQRVRDHEIRLLLSYIVGNQGKGPLGVECPALDSSAGHIKRFVSECTGLGVMSAASQALFDWTPKTDGLGSFDNYATLPGKSAGAYAKTGVRPDLLYDLAAGPVAGEARGRRRDAKEMLPPGKGNPEQKQRLAKLAQWSVDHGDHAYFMSWVWLGVGGVYVDIFLPDGSAALTGLKTGWIDEPGDDAKPWQFRVPRPDPRRAESPEPEGDLVVTAPLPEFSGEGVATRAAISRVAPAAEAAMDRAFSREEHQLGTLAGVPVRGRWIRGDVLGVARHEVLLGVLGERIEVDRRAQRERLATLATDRLDTFLDGRLLTVVRPVDDPPPTWDRISAELLEQS